MEGMGGGTQPEEKVGTYGGKKKSFGNSLLELNELRINNKAGVLTIINYSNNYGIIKKKQKKRSMLFIYGYSWYCEF